MKKIKYNPTLHTARITVSTVCETPHIGAADTPEKSVEYWKNTVEAQPDFEPDKETLVVVMLNARLRPFAWNRVSLGTVDSCTAHPRDILRPVIMAGAYGFVLMHNHPSGDPTPSQADKRVTRRIVEASQLMQLTFLDHVIVGKPSPGHEGYYSFREAGIVRA